MTLLGAEIQATLLVSFSRFQAMKQPQTHETRASTHHPGAGSAVRSQATPHPLWASVYSFKKNYLFI